MQEITFHSPTCPLGQYTSNKCHFEDLWENSDTASLEKGYAWPGNELTTCEGCLHIPEGL